MTEWVTQSDGTKFFTKTWKPEGTPVANVVFVHGFVEHIERYEHVFSKFAEKGIEVYAWDQRGFGKTSAETDTNGVTKGWKAALNDINEAVKKTRKEGTPCFIMGHSMGGGLALTYASTHPEGKNLAGVIASAPLVEIPAKYRPNQLAVAAGSLASKVIPSMPMKVDVNPDHVSRDEDVRKAYANDPLVHRTGTLKGVADMLAGGKALLAKNYETLTLPLLITHGTGDKLTCDKASKAFFDKCPSKDKTYETFPDAYHELHNEKEEKEKVIQLYIDWILSHCQKPASL